MSITLMSKIWRTNLPTAEKMVMLVIADHANDDGTNAWPGVATIARKTSMSERTVQRYIKALEESGLILVVAQGGGTKDTRNDRRPNRYDIILSALHGVTNSASDVDGVTNEASRGDKNDVTGCQTEQNGVTPVSPYPSLEPSDEPSLEPSEKAQILRKSSLDVAVVGAFDVFWGVYPRKVDKKKALAVWVKLSEDDRLAALKAVGEHRSLWEVKRVAPEFIPHPTSWLNGRRWEDELIPQQMVVPVFGASRSAPGMGLIKHIIQNKQGELGG